MARSRQSTPEQREAFGVALREAAENAGHGSSIQLATFLTMHGHKVTQTAVAGWMRGSTEPERPTVLLVEELLGLTPGALSCRLGWVPVGSSIDDIEAAILSDPGLTPAHADALVTMLRTFRQS